MCTIFVFIRQVDCTICVFALKFNSLYDFRVADRVKIAKAIQTWVATNLEAKKVDQGIVAKAIGVARPRVSEIAHGKRKVYAVELAGLSEALESPVPAVVGLDSEFSALWNELRDLDQPTRESIIAGLRSQLSALKQKRETVGTTIGNPDNAPIFVEPWMERKGMSMTGLLGRLRGVDESAVLKAIATKHAPLHLQEQLHIALGIKLEELRRLPPPLPLKKPKSAKRRG